MRRTPPILPASTGRNGITGEDMMKTLENLTKDEIIELLNRSWMTHDGMWFYHCFRECGIETANRVNKAAIRSLAPMEIERMKKVLDVPWDRPETFDEFREFFTAAAGLCVPAFMNVTMDLSRRNVLHWEFSPGNCFAYKGIRRIGAIEKYECGVIYRLASWFDALGLQYRTAPEVTACRMASGDACAGAFVFDFGEAVSK
jgi:hypothetical protein